MPQIPTYNTPESEQRLNVPQGGSSALASAGLRVGRAGQEAANTWERGVNELSAGVGQIGKVLDDEEATHQEAQIAPQIALLQNKHMVGLNAAEDGATPADSTQRLLKFKADTLDADKQQFLGGFTNPRARATAEKAWGTHEAELFHQGAAIVAQRTGDMIANGLYGGNDMLATSVGQNPTLLPVNLQLINENIDRAVANPNIPEALRHHFDTDYRQQITKQAFENAVGTTAAGSGDGKIAPNPDAAQRMLDDPQNMKYSGGRYDELSKSIAGARHQVRIDAEHNQADQDRQQRETSTAEAGNLLKQFTVDPETNRIIPPKDFGINALHNDKLLPNERTTLQALATRLTAENDNKTTPGLLNQFTQRLTLPSGDPNRPSNNEIMGHIGKDLSLEDGRFLMQMNNPKTPNDKLGNNQVVTGYKMLENFFNPFARDDQGVATGSRRNGPNDALNVEMAHAWYNTAVQAGLDRGLSLLQLTSPQSPDYVLGKVDPATGIPENLKHIPGLVGNPFAAPPNTDEKSWFQKMWNTVNPFDPGSGVSGEPSTPIPGRQGALSRPPTDAQLPFMAATESSDRNVTNPTATTSGNAEGYYQITTGTWKDFAPKAGVSLAEYPSAISAPKSVQAKVAKTIPLRRWDPNTIRYLAQQGALG